MRNGKSLVEQVDINGNFVNGYDSILSQKEIFEILQQSFPVTNSNNIYIGKYKYLHFAIKVSNINYLGNPHPINKKRVQISSNIFSFYNDAKEKNLYPLLFGIYSFQKNIVFVDFQLKNYIKNNLHNSSAHILTEDISEAMHKEIFQKYDTKFNKITVFRKQFINKFFDYLIESIEESKREEEIINSI